MSVILLPVEVIGGCILPLLSIRELQALNVAFTSQHERQCLRNVWKSYHYKSRDGITTSITELEWLISMGIIIDSLNMSQVESSTLEHIPTNLTGLRVFKYTIFDTEPYGMLEHLADVCPLLEVLQFSVLNTLLYNSIDLLMQQCNDGVAALAKHCPRLHTLSLMGAYVSDTALQLLCDNCPNLIHIGLSRCQNITDASLQAIATAYPRLQSIDIIGCEFTEDALMFFADKCHELRALAMSCTNLSGRCLTALFAAEPHLESVVINCIYQVSTQYLISLLAQCCPQLHILNISVCSEIAGADITISQLFPQLQELSTVSCKWLNDSFVIAVAEKCVHLTTLNISQCNVSDAAFIALGQHCRELKSIDISHIRISNAGIEALAKGCPLIEVFVAKGSFLSDSGVIALSKGCRRLLKVDLCFNKAVTKYGIAAIAMNCPLLSILDLYDCDLVDDICMCILAEYCRNLTVLDVRGTRVCNSASVVAVIKSCRQLQALRVPDCILGRTFCKRYSRLLR